MRSRNMNSAEVKSVYKALQEDTAFAAYGDTSRSYGFVTVRNVNIACEAAAAIL